MIDSNFSCLSLEDRKILRQKVFELLESYGVKLDPHPQMFKLLKSADLVVDEDNNNIKFPKSILEELIKKAPK